jgi:dolichol-phosphate mannosyltransferase
VTLLIVTPMRDERANVDGIVATLATQTLRDFAWIVVDDGSTDGTADAVREALSDFDAPARVLHKPNDGGLIGGSAYTSWRYGVRAGLAGGAFTHVMKLDADVRLAPDYLQRATALAVGTVGIAGGVIATPGMREQKLHVPGPVKLYSLAAYRATEGMPEAIGFDVLDEMAVAGAGLATRVDPDARFELARPIGASEGRLHGRYRNGRVCRWTGYSFPYFLLHVARYLVRRPFVVGSLAMLWGYARAGRGPYAAELRRAHGRMQRAKLVRAARDPLGFWRSAYQL